MEQQASLVAKEKLRHIIKLPKEPQRSSLTSKVSITQVILIQGYKWISITEALKSIKINNPSAKKPLITSKRHQATNRRVRIESLLWGLKTIILTKKLSQIPGSIKTIESKNSITFTKAINCWSQWCTPLSQTKTWTMDSSRCPGQSHLSPIECPESMVFFSNQWTSRTLKASTKRQW